jgi:hypothetical protein
MLTYTYERQDIIQIDFVTQSVTWHTYIIIIINYVA